MANPPSTPQPHAIPWLSISRAIGYAGAVSLGAWAVSEAFQRGIIPAAPDWLVGLAGTVALAILLLLFWTHPEVKKRRHLLYTHRRMALPIFIIAWVLLGVAVFVIGVRIAKRSPPPVDSEENRANAEAAQRLSRIEFRTDSAKPLRSLRIGITLNRSFSPDELGHFRVLVDFVNLRSDSFVMPNLWIGLRDAYAVSHSEGKKELMFGLRGFVRGASPDIGGSLANMEAGAAGDQIDFDFDLDEHVPYRTLDDLDGKVVRVFVTESLIDKIKAFTLLGNNYLLLQTDAKESRAIKLQPGESWPWPWPLSPAEQAQPWRYVVVGKPNAPRPMEGAWMFDFDENMPRKAIRSGHTGQSR